MVIGPVLRRGGTLFPPEIYPDDEEKEESHVISQSLLNQGQINYQLDRAEKLHQGMALQQQQPTSLNAAMHQTGAELSDPNVEKDPAWWQRALGVLEPLKYLDIPMELGIEVIEGLIPGQWAGESNVEPRKDWEAWTALFGRNQGGFKERIDKAAEATEKRPWWMELGVGALQIAATGGSGALLKGAQAAGKGVRLAQIARGGSMVLDPYEIGFRGIRAGYRGGKQIAEGRRAVKADGTSLHVGLQNTDADEYEALKDTVEALEDSPAKIWKGKGVVGGGSQFLDDLIQSEYFKDMPTEQFIELFKAADPAQQSAISARKSWDYDTPYFSIRNNGQKVVSPEVGYKQINAEGFEDDVLPFMAARGNVMRELVTDIKRKMDEAPRGSDEELENARDLLAFQLGISVGSRQGHTFSVMADNMFRSERSLAKSNRIDHFETKPNVKTGKIRSMIMTPLDDGEAQDAVQFYKGALEEWSKRNVDYISQITGIKIDPTGSSDELLKWIDDKDQILTLDTKASPGQRFFKNNEEIFSGEGAPDTTLNSLLARVKDSDPERWDLLPDKGGLFRQQKTSEMILQLTPFENIAKQLNHSSTQPTSGYARTVAFIGDESPMMNDARATRNVVESIGRQVGMTQWVEEALRDTVSTPTRLAKGMTEGAVALDQMYMQLGYAFTRSTEGVAHLKKYMPAMESQHFDEIFIENRLGIDFTLPNALKAKDFAGQALMMRALIAKADAVERTRNFAEGTKSSINHNYGNVKDRRKLFNTKTTGYDKPGQINRAGYFVNEDGAVEWGGKAWRAKREQYRKAAAMPEEIFGESAENVDENWLRWAENLYDQVKHADEIRAHATLRPEASTNANYWVDTAIREFVDVEKMRIVNEWTNIPRAERDIYNFDSLFKGLIDYPVSPTGQGLSSKYWGSGAHGYNAAFNELKNTMKTSNIFNNYWQRTRVAIDPFDKDAIPKRRYMRMNEQDMANQFRDAVPMEQFLAWLDDPDVVSAFGVVRLNNNTPAVTIQEKLATLAKKTPRIFGDDFAAFQKNNPGQAAKWIEILANRIGNNRWAWIKAQAIAEAKDAPDEFERLVRMRTGRGRARYAEGLREGLGQELAERVSGKGTLGSVPMTVNRISTLTNVFGKNFQSWINEDSLYKKVLKTTVINPVFTIFQGGKAGIAPLITRGMSARAHLFPLAEENGDMTRIVFNDIGGGVDAQGAFKGLGLTADEATPEMLADGIDAGQQFFKVLDDLLLDRDEIWRYEETDAAKNANIRYAPKTGVTANGTVYHRFDAAMRGDEELIRKHMTQVDILMERIRPEHWKHYFDGVAVDGKNAHIYNKLLYLRDVFFQVDELARDRGLDLVKIIDDRGVEYLDDYFARFYKQTDKGIRITKDAGGMLTDGAEGFFKNREIDDIVNVLAKSAGKDSKTLKAHDFILEDFSVRAGKYVESVQKKIIDFETVKWLQDTPEFKAGAALRTESRRQQDALNALELLINQHARGDINNLNADSLDRAVRFWGSGKGEALSIDSFNIEMLKEGAEVIPEDVRGKILSQIQSAREQIDNDWLNKVGSEKGGDGADWLKSTLSVLGLREQRALQEYAQLTTRNFGQDTLKWTAKAAAPVSALLRYFKSGLDVGAPMIHGFNSLVRIPINRQGKLDWTTQKAWLKGVKKMAQFWWEPERYEAFKLERIGDMSEARQYVHFSTPEPLMITDDKTLQAVRSWVSRKLPEHKHAKFLSRFEASFAGFLDVLRTEIFTTMKISVDRELDDMAEAARKIGGQFDMAAKQNEMYHDLGATVNKMTGAFDPHLSQQTPFQTLVENSLLFFAPMYRRATFGILADVFRFRGEGKGVRSEQALRQIGGVVAVGAAMGMLAEMTGNNPRGFLFDEEGDLGEEGELDLSARFGKFNVHGIQTGIGTAWWTAMRVASDIAMHYAHQDDDGVIDLSEDSHWSDHWFFTLMQRRGRSQLAPATGLATDIFSGRTFIGEPLRDGDENNFEAIGLHMAKSAVPFWLDGAFSGNSWQGGGIAMATEFMGFQSYPLSSWDKLTAARESAIMSTTIPDIVEWRKTRIAEGKNPNYINMPRTLQRMLNDQETNVRLLYQEHEEKYGRVATGNARDLRLFMEDKNRVTLEGTKKLSIISGRWERGEVDFDEVIALYSSIKTSKQIQSVALMQKYPAMAEYFAQLRAGREGDIDTGFLGDIYYDKWQSVRNDPIHTDPYTGVFSYEKMQMAEDAFWADPHASQFKEYILDRHRQWVEPLPLIKEFELAKDDIKASGYWEVQNLIWKPGSKGNVEANKYLKWNSDMQKEMRDRNFGYMQIHKALSKRREQIRATNAIVDAHLVKFYGYTPLHPANRGLDTYLYKQRMNGDFIKTPNFEDYSISPTGNVLTGVQ